MRLLSIPVIALVLAAACDGREPIGNTPLTNALLDAHVPGVRFGTTFDSLARYGNVVEVTKDPSGPTMNLHLHQSARGFSGLRVLGSVSETDSVDVVKAYGFIFYSPGDSSTAARTRAETLAADIFGRRGQPGCMGYNKDLSGSVLIWEEDSGSVVLVLARQDAPNSDLATTRLIILPRGVSARSATPNLRGG